MCMHIDWGNRLEKMVVFESLHPDIFYLISLYLTPSEIIHLSSLNRTFHTHFLSNHIWDQIILMKYSSLYSQSSNISSISTYPSNMSSTPSLSTAPTPSSSSSPLIKLSITNSLLLYRSIITTPINDQILSKNIYVTSIDREEESGENVLFQSHCHMAMSRYHQQIQANPRYGIQFQMHCGCYFGHPCYWSSKGTDADVIEELIFSTHHSIILLSSFNLTPYQSFFHPNFPIYAPYSTQLILLLSDNQTSYYESPIYEVQSSSFNQNFPLPSPVLYCGGSILIRLYGKRQSQPIGPNDYYVCLSYIGVTGKILNEFISEKGTSTNNSVEFYHIHLK